MITPEQERLEQNVRRAAGIHALRQIHGTVDKDLREEAARAKLLRAVLRYGWILLLPAAAALARYLGVI